MQPYAVDFLLGLLIAMVCERVDLPSRWACLALGMLAMIAALASQVPLLTCLGAGAVIVGLIQIERVPRSLELLGDASYSIYLLHFPALAFVSREFGISSPAALVAAGVGAGLILHLTVEAPLLRAFKGRRAAPKVPAPAV